MSRSKDTLAITVLTVLTIALPASAGYRDYSKAISISGGEDHTLVVTANNWAWSCGPNGHRVGEVTYYYGVLGTASNDPDLQQKVLVRIHGPGDVGYLEGISYIGAGWQHSLALDVNDSVWSWGFNLQGQLGIGMSGPEAYRTTPVQVLRGEQADDPCQASAYLKHIIAISAGRSGEHSLAADANGYAYAWGYNKYGQCGNAVSGDGERELTPVHVHQGQQPNDPCDPNNWLKHIIAVSAAQTHSMALEAIDVEDPNYDGKVYTFGSDSWPTDYGNYAGGSGKLGVGDSAGDSNTPVCVHRGEQDYNDPNQIYLKHIVAISAGWDHSMALEQYDVYDPFLPNFDPNHKGRVYTWGNNGAGWGDGPGQWSDGGRLGDGSTVSSSTPVLVLRGEQQPEDPCNADPNLTRIVAVSAGEAHSMALDVNGYVHTWGDNRHGQLGDGTNDQRLVPVRVVGQDRNRNGIHDANEGYLENIMAISAGYWHSLAIDANGTIWTWGKGSAGRLGLGNKTIDCNTPHPIPVVYNVTQETFAFAIQTAIDHANDAGDTLEASPGTYYENVNFRDKSVTLRSAEPGDSNVVADTVVDAAYNSGSDYHFYQAVDFNDGSGSTLAGLTLMNAPGGGVLCEDVDSVSIMNCSIQKNDCDGIYLDGSLVNITGCEIRANASNEAYEYCGVYCISGSDLNIVNCVVADNDGNGISCNQSNAAITDSKIQDNADFGVEATGDCNVTIERSLVEGNGKSGVCAHNGCDFVLTGSIVCDNGWDGVGLEYNSSNTLTNNWIHNNGTIDDTFRSGIWFLANYVSSPVVRNNTICANPTYGIQVGDASYTDPNILNCIIYGNGGGDLQRPSGTFASVNYCCLQDSHSGTGNIVVDPCFIGADANDFHLDANSPCIDKGDPAFVAEPNETDIDGENRVEDGDANGTIIVDMGADEFYWSPADYSGDGIVNFIDYAMLTSYWQDAGIDYNDVFLDGDSNSLGLAEFCDRWLWQAGSLTGPLPLMAGRGGAGILDESRLDAGLSAVATAERGAAVAEPVDIEAIMKWLAEIWLDPDVQKSIDHNKFLKVYESLKGL